MPTLRRSGARSGVLHVFSLALIVSGALLLGDAILTVVWQEPMSALYAGLAQRGLERELDALEQRALRPEERRIMGRLRTSALRMRFLARRTRARTGPGGALGRIIAPAAGIDSVVVHGTDTASLRKGPGHFPSTALPGQGGTVAVAGHRTTYQAPFRDIDDLRPGDRISVEMPYGTFRYRVEGRRIVSPRAWWVVRNVSYPRLVLTACHPRYSAAQRIVVFARQVAALV